MKKIFLLCFCFFSSLANGHPDLPQGYAALLKVHCITNIGETHVVSVKIVAMHDHSSDDQVYDLLDTQKQFHLRDYLAIKNVSKKFLTVEVKEGPNNSRVEKSQTFSSFHDAQDFFDKTDLMSVGCVRSKESDGTTVIQIIKDITDGEIMIVVEDVNVPKMHS